MYVHVEVLEKKTAYTSIHNANLSRKRFENILDFLLWSVLSCHPSCVCGGWGFGKSINKYKQCRPQQEEVWIHFGFYLLVSHPSWASEMYSKDRNYDIYWNWTMLFFSLHFMVIIMYSLIVTYSSSVTSNGLYHSLSHCPSLSLWWWIFIWDQVQVENLHNPAAIY